MAVIKILRQIKSVVSVEEMKNLQRNVKMS